MALYPTDKITPQSELWSDRLAIIGFLAYLLWNLMVLA
ncbi:high light inducible protein [Nostoc sphaeroides CCNUC1]|uniref:High light inducible protein n=1 Tax=Nostoc sphaeroides CCNUC1 TaxID=2653204 RepID=A0A5P8W2J0_9NOSO|nr:high light inducible protein [Nostoc sphaeroides CCNUC1]